jgi:uncharacterized protein (DUF2147 family)
MKKLIAFSVFYLTINFVSYSQSGDAINGIWWTQEKDSKVQIYKSGNQYFGKIVWARDPNDKEGKPKIDKNNPDPAQKTRPIMGMVFLKNFQFKGDDVYKEGEIYDPRNGKTYSCKMTLKGKEIDVRGYIGSPMFGKTVTFTRVE